MWPFGTKRPPKPSEDLDTMLSRLGECGIALAPGISREAVATFHGSATLTYEKLLCTLGCDTDDDLLQGTFSPNILHVDTECIYDDGDYAGIARGFATLAQGDFPIEDLRDHVGEEPPRQASFDGGFASRENLRIAKDDLHVQDVAFHKKCGLEIQDMTRSPWVFRQLRRFRSGIEGIISTLKSGGMDRCTWRSQDSLESFRCYVWSCVLALNVTVIARHMVANSA